MNLSHRVKYAKIRFNQSYPGLIIFMTFLKLLPKLPFTKNASKQEYFFAMNIYSHKVEAAIWGIVNKKLVIVNSASAEIENSNLAEAANIALDLSLLDFQPEPTQILFGVPDSWLSDDSLKDEYLKKLRDLVKELDVTPMAYVSSSHSVAHLLQKQQGIPITAILIGLGDTLSLNVVKGGKVLTTKSVKKSGNLGEDIERGLLSVTEIEVLPSKMFLYPLSKQEHLDRIKDELHSYPWMQNLPFLHLPKIEVLSDKISIIATTYAGASEIEEGVQVSEQSLKGILTSELKVPERAHHIEKFSSSDDVRKVDKDALEDLGFVSGDVENVKATEASFDSEIEESFDHPRRGHEDIHEGGDVHKEFPVASHHEVKAPPLSLVPKLALSSFGIRLGFLGKSLVIPIILFLVLLGSYIFLVKAEVKLFIDPKILEKEAQVIVDPAITTVDEANKKIPGKVVSTTLSGSEKTQATGKKKIGDFAKGSVNVYNLTNNKVNLSSGTTLSSSGGLKFSLDSTVSIASESASIGADFTTVTTPGKANSGVSASAIGPDSNLPAGTTLTVSGYTQEQVVAKVDTALSGGTSKDVTVVTDEDQKKLLALALSNLRKKAKDEMQSKLSGEAKILEEGLTESNVSPNFSKRINDQASEFSINLSVTFKGTSYQDADLKAFVSKLVEINVPEGFTLNLGEAETQADIVKAEKDGKLIFLAKFKAKLMPKLDLGEVKSKIKGKSPQEAITIVKQIENVVSSEIKITPSLPGPLARLPVLPQNITVEVEAK